MKKIYFISFWIIILSGFLITYFEKENYLPIVIFVFIFWLSFLIKEVFIQILNIKFFNNYCRYGLFYLAKTKYENINSIVITNHNIKTRHYDLQRTVSIKSNNSTFEVPLAFVSLHQNELLNDFLEPENSSIYKNKFKIVNLIYHREKNRKLNSSEIRHEKSFIVGFPLRNGKFIVNFLKQFKGTVYLKMSIYEYHQEYLDYLFTKSSLNIDQIKIVDDGLHFEKRVSTLSLYKKHLHKN